MKTAEFQRRLLERAGAAGLTVAASVLDRLELYHSLLTHWNKRINLTSLRLEPLSDEALDRLLIEPLMASKYVKDAPLNWLDLGSGGGSPAIPLKIVRPGAALKLIETRSRKAAFLREVVRQLVFPDVDVVNARFEECSTQPDFENSADLITVRAVKVDSPLAETTRRLLRGDGELLLFSNRKQADALSIPGLIQIAAVRLLPEASTNLIIYKLESVSRGTSC